MTRTALASVLFLATTGCIVGQIGSGDAATETRDAPGAVAN